MRINGGPAPFVWVTEVLSLLYPRAGELSFISQSKNLLNFLCVNGFLPFLIPLPIPLPALLGITSQINALTSISKSLLLWELKLKDEGKGNILLIKNREIPGTGFFWLEQMFAECLKVFPCLEPIYKFFRSPSISRVISLFIWGFYIWVIKKL